MTSKVEAPKEAFVWGWLPSSTEPVVMGRLEKDGDRYLFNYGRSYLGSSNPIPIYLPELPLVSGVIEPAPPLAMASALRDAAPDAWGRRIIINRLIGERRQAARNIELDELTYLLESGSDRIGAFDFQASPTEYVPRGRDVVTLEELQQAADCVEEGALLTSDLADVLQHGTAIGGARPKALVDNEDTKYIAKFSSSNDTYSVVKGEFIAMRLAASVGLNVTDVRLTTSLGKDVLLIKRFDRELTPNGWARRMLVSALTLQGLHEVMAVHASYSDLAEIIRQRFTRPKDTLLELFSRLVFNILIGNTDDHARNHAAFWDGQILSLTPAYDICPQGRSGREANQAMKITDNERRSQLIHCITAAPSFHLTENRARDIIESQVHVIQNDWSEICDEAQLAQVDKNLFWKRQFLNDYAFEGFYER